jgi:hypothetical protein
MTVLFIPRTLIFSGNSIAGAGAVLQVTYTVPPGKRAVIEHSVAQVNANGNAVNSTFSFIQATINAVNIIVNALHGSGATFTQRSILMHSLSLTENDVVQLFTQNFGAANVAHLMNVVIREYQ